MFDSYLSPTYFSVLIAIPSFSKPSGHIFLIPYKKISKTLHSYLVLEMPAVKGLLYHTETLFVTASSVNFKLLTMIHSPQLQMPAINIPDACLYLSAYIYLHRYGYKIIYIVLCDFGGFIDILP